LKKGKIEEDQTEVTYQQLVY